MLDIQATIRDSKKSVRAVRREGFMPAVFYGSKQTAVPISISAKEFSKVWKEAGESAVVSLKGDFGNKEALIHDIQFHPLSGAPLHADFYVFEKGQKVKVEIPIEFTGTSSAVKDLGGILVKVAHDLEIEAEPRHLPPKIKVDISPLIAFNSVILAKEVKLPEGVTLVINPEEVIVSVSEPKEEEEAVAPPADLSQIEISEKRGKEETEEGGAPSALGASNAGKGSKPEEKKEVKK